MIRALTEQHSANEVIHLEDSAEALILFKD
jgi:hypothetical protein